MRLCVRGKRTTAQLFIQMLEKAININIEQLRLIGVSLFSYVLGFFTPTKGFLLALVVMYAFNIWAGMRADGVSIVTCKNFSFSKFKNSLFELFLYLTIVETLFTVMQNMGDIEAAIVVAKSLTYVFMYIYMQNALKNLIKAYPKRIALRIIYHVIRFEFARALPSHVQEIVNRVQQELEKDEQNRDSGLHSQTDEEKEN